LLDTEPQAVENEIVPPDGNPNLPTLDGNETPMARVSVPLLFHDLTGGNRHVEVPGSTVAEVIAELDKVYPGLQDRLRNGDRIAPIVAVTVDGKIAAQGLATPVGPESEVALLPSFGGG